jgi:hypothetical protein
MATVTPGYTFSSNEVVTPAKLTNLAANATVTNIVAADISNDAITTAKIADANVTTAKIVDNAITTAKIVDASVNDAKLANGAVTGAANGGKLAASAITGQTEMTDELASGDEFLVHDTSASALRKVDWSKLQPLGTVLQTQSEVKSGWQTLTHTTDWGNPNTARALPVSTAGVEVIAKSIHLSSASNKVLVSVNIPALTSAEGYMQMILFRGTTAIQGDTGYLTTDRIDRSAWSAPTTLVVMDAPNTTGNVTYSVRVAKTFSPGTFYLNGISTSQLGGGVYKAVITLQEIKA